MSEDQQPQPAPHAAHDVRALREQARVKPEQGAAESTRVAAGGALLGEHPRGVPASAHDKPGPRAALALQGHASQAPHDAAHGPFQNPSHAP
ncbi:MAG: hypothetical protein ABW321_22875, partial [Polyangiales bacterium]